MTTEVQSATRFEYLDVLRGIAVFGVVLFHSQSIFFLGRAADNQSLDSPALQAFANIVFSGRFGVEVFFGLSGFLIATIYLSRGFSPASFFRHRFFRIAPLWMAFGVVWSVVFVIDGRPTESMAQALLLSLFFLLWISPDHYDSFIGGAWSIQIEVICYAIFAFTRKWSKQSLILLAIAVNIAGALVSGFDLTSVGALESLRRLSFQTGFNFFLAGWLVGLLRLEFVSWKVTLQTLATGWLPILFIGWIGTFLMTPAMYGNPFEALGFVLLALIVTFLAPSLLRQILRWLGVYSYFIFFSHFLLLYLAAELISPNAFEGQPEWLFVPITLLVTIGVILLSAPFALASMRYFERPMQAVGKRFDQPKNLSNN